MTLNLDRIRRLTEEYENDPTIPEIAPWQVTVVVHLVGGEVGPAHRVMRRNGIAPRDLAS